MRQSRPAGRHPGVQRHGRRRSDVGEGAIVIAQGSNATVKIGGYVSARARVIAQGSNATVTHYGRDPSAQVTAQGSNSKVKDKGGDAESNDLSDIALDLLRMPAMDQSPLPTPPKVAEDILRKLAATRSSKPPPDRSGLEFGTRYPRWLDNAPVTKRVRLRKEDGKVLTSRRAPVPGSSGARNWSNGGPPSPKDDPPFSRPEEDDQSPPGWFLPREGCGRE